MFKYSGAYINLSFYYCFDMSILKSDMGGVVDNLCLMFFSLCVEYNSVYLCC